MKIGIVTFFKSYNYGVWLQAYATQEFFKIQGYDAEIIDYENNFEKKKANLLYREGNRNIGYATSLLKSILFGKVRYYKKGFKPYIEKCYKLSEKKYKDASEMTDVPYDVLVAGSDQVWNPKITNGMDRVFLLQFGQPCKRISVASSMGSKALGSIEKEQLLQALQSFNAISVREEFACEYLEAELKKKIKVICDPTFLITRKQWVENVAKKSKYYKIKSKYILTYFVSNEKRKSCNIELVKSYSDKFSLPVWAIQFTSYFSNGVDKKILGASMFDFIALLLGAEIIITDSFHGVALSANLNKNFIAITNRENPIRTQNLLSKIGLLNRMGMQSDEYLEIDYSLPNDRIERMRKDAQKWIVETLEND